MVITSLLAAAVALFVAVWDRRRVARDERQHWERVERRAVYGRFLGALYSLGQADTAGNEDQAVAHFDNLAIAMSELELIAGDEVGAIAMQIIALATDSRPMMQKAETLSDLRVRLARAARRELGVAS